ncbi:flagellar M-ring protein FliF [Limnohabitans sp. Rim8]|uniref:Flagellar M-ring protein FliF n=1 Tax=Limnohabitans curvus TaxID=323423 RepID=A0A315ESL5_9BURK|nr:MULTISPECIES: flagellar basal-body MS-ring/collar protein FliF [Limnohabitans]PUE56585.1 flagellar M-ring protein FliF [Limnohabitans sp. Rim8]PUE59838.1 flagellar M-ring protein FliF [Limnohabitans curvus]
MATDTLNMNAVGMPVANGVDNASASNANGAASGDASRMPAWINAKEGPGAVVMDVLRQPSVRKVLPFVVIFMLLMSVAVFFTSMKPTPYRPLVLMLNDADKQLAIEALKTGEYKPEVDANTGQISVPTNRYQEARMLLASKGLPRTEASGMDNLKDMPAMTTSQFMEQVRYNNAMEQELARSIVQIGGIKSARVHLAAPKQSVFVRDRAPTKASVIITRLPGRTISSANVQAIIQLVASSVPYLAPENVSVVDNFGSLMNDMLTEAPLGLTAQQLTHKQQMEDLYRTRLIQLLAPIVGETNVTAQVSMSLDFTQTEVTNEEFDGQDKGPKTRSELFVEDRNTFRDAIGIPGSLSNTPPAPTNPQATTQTNADPLKGVSEKGVQVTARSTKNYELDRAVRHTKGAMGTITKIGVGVLINERPVAPGAKVEKNADGSTPTSVPYTPEEIERLNQLVKGAVGFNNDRGDVVTVVGTKFEPQYDPTVIPWYRDENYQVMVNAGVVGGIFLLILLTVVRPMVRRLLAPEIDPKALAAAAADAATSQAQMAIDVATAENAAAQAAAAHAKRSHEGEMLRISEEAIRAAEESARLAQDATRTAEEARLAAEAKAAADALAAEEARLREEALRAERDAQIAVEAAAHHAAVNAAAEESSEEIEIEEGESLESVKARMASMKPKKQSISADLLNTANSYDDKVALIRMIMAEDSTRVAGVLKSLIEK